MPWTYGVSDVNGEEKQPRVEKVIKRRDSELYVKWKGYDSSFNRCIDKKRHNRNEWIFSKNKSFGHRLKVELYLSDYAIKADLKNATGVNTSKVSKKVDIQCWKSEVDKSDIDKLEKYQLF